MSCKQIYYNKLKRLMKIVMHFSEKFIRGNEHSFKLMLVLTYFVNFQTHS